MSVLISLLAPNTRNIKDTNELTGNSLHGFTEAKLCLTRLIACRNEIDNSVGKWRTVDVMYLLILSLYYPCSQPGVIQTGKWPVRWMENLLDRKLQKGGINDTSSDWWMVSSGITQGLYTEINTV